MEVSGVEVEVSGVVVVWRWSGAGGRRALTEPQSVCALV